MAVKDDVIRKRIANIRLDLSMARDLGDSFKTNVAFVSIARMVLEWAALDGDEVAQAYLEEIESHGN